MNRKTTKYLIILIAILSLIFITAKMIQNTTSEDDSAAVETSSADSSHNDVRDIQNTGETEPKESVIYSLPDDVFNLPVEQIPYYSAGDIMFLQQSIFDSFSNGHQPWLGSPVSVVQVRCKNLIGDSSVYGDLMNSLSSEKTHEYPLIDTADQYQLSDGLDIKLIQSTKGVYVVQMTVPNLGNYKITLESPLGDGILYIRKIIFSPNIK